MEKEYYREYYELERSHWYFKARTNILRVLAKKYNPVEKKLKILNIGVATGGTTRLLEEFGEVTSVEYDKECCEFLENTAGIKAINASILDLPFGNNTFDLVCAFDVIEHVEDDQLAVREMARVTRDDGVNMLTVPAYMFLWSRHDEINHHFRRYTKPKLLKLFRKTEMRPLFKSYYNFFLFFPITFYRVFFSKLIRSKKGTGSDFEGANSSKFLSKIFYRIFNAEKGILKMFRLPVGVSIIVVLKKEYEPAS